MINITLPFYDYVCSPFSCRTHTFPIYKYYLYTISHFFIMAKGKRGVYLIVLILGM